ncbi:hypothetical protein [Streptomyces violaceus]|uniref:Uncharacterized protein n=1 Tax=Streptomyces violaceus TaxID=1936 RepID=A0ABY9UPA6_STRVL|nr:hypothetical protein [Streptomyces janthinus]WND24041.1 hypothetical protein RI060_09405 [Streptomyces janthinus]GGS37136.1 hypothetical protein GCM10010270_02870 [Streptomyces janthinus]
MSSPTALFRFANCAVCQTNWKQLNVCKKKGDITQASKHATKIRDHAGGGHDCPRDTRPHRGLRRCGAARWGCGRDDARPVHIPRDTGRASVTREGV